MAKPAPGPSLKWTGTSGNDTKIVASLTELKNTVYDAGAGYDTLDLSQLTSGISLQLTTATQGNKTVWHSLMWADSPFHGSWWGWSQFDQVGTRTADSVLNFEKVIGTGFNDYINLTISNAARVADGGAGDDAITLGGIGGSSTSVGGAGSDQLISGRSEDILIGGTYDGVHATGDSTPDEFFLSGGTVLDFELGTDHLYIDNNNSPLAAAWTDVSTSYGPGAQLLTSYGTTITLVGETASAMNQVPEGFALQNSNTGAQITSGPGDDFLLDHATVATTYNFSLDSGHDTLVGLDLGVDTLVFPDAPTASDTSYHGDVSVLLTFGGGLSSVLLAGVTSADLSNVHMQYPA